MKSPRELLLHPSSSSSSSSSLGMTVGLPSKVPYRLGAAPHGATLNDAA
jgi:hypothetical protein